ncbi:glutamine synthetase family protein [Kitasatospora sp. RB6PN24]|uniref:glutamine synthetase family protein n=1 Tax=Kitasatospora humi TaxID=2893891 RepID=UPI001E5A7B1D|nr:glutamine synthetase family protein [Kitasatospora humi]MCC9309159.1 glutamine synthetase family protein [Kitasatospora humi]
MTGQTSTPRGLNSELLALPQLREAITAGQITTVMLALVDVQGRLKGKAFDAVYFLRHFVDSPGEGEMCAYVLATDIEMAPLTGVELAGWQTGFGDFRVLPDLASARLLPWRPGTALVFAAAVTPDGTDPVQVAPTAMLAQQINLLAEAGLSVKAGLEAEFVLYRGTLAQAAGQGFQGLTPVTADNRDYSLDHPAGLVRYLQRLTEMLRRAGQPVEAVKTESAPGQVEITFPYGDPVEAARGHLLLKHAARAVGERMRLLPTFMAAPATGIGSGLHLHLSLWDDADAPQMADPDRPGELSETGQHAIAGLLEALPVLAPLWAPTVNSYKRFRRNSFAPTRYTWGRDNRTCAVRVVGHGPGLHVEVRLAGADANPYLALAASVAAMRHGIETRLAPPEPVKGNSYRTTAGSPLPATLREAADLFESSTLPGTLLGEDVVQHYASLARAELAAHDSRVTDVELQRGFAQT